MIRRIKTIVCGCILLGTFLFAAVGWAHSPEEAQFQAWLAQFKQQATKENVKPEVCDAIAQHIHYDPDVVRAYRNQPEVRQTLARYLHSVALTAPKIEDGRKHMKVHGDLLDSIEKKYGVSRSVIVAIWGLESFYGAVQGRYNVAQALATLAASDLRRPWATRELLVLYKLISDNVVTLEQLRGSWAGAMGQAQFIPSSYERYAVDFNGDGKKDIWTNTPDALASIANYLRVAGHWEQGRLWGMEIETKCLPANAPAGTDGLKKSLPLGEWTKKGIRPLNKPDFPPSLPHDKLYLLTVPDEGRAFLVSNNFLSILTYNRHPWYALAVGLMSDRIQET